MPNVENLITEISKSIDEQGHDWRASVTSLSHYDVPDLQKMLGYTPSGDELTEDQRHAITDARDSHPSGSVSQIDWRAVAGKNYVMPVREQGFCGSCVAFAVTAAMESRARIIKQLSVDAPNGATLPQLSPAQLFYCGLDGAAKCLRGWGVTEALTVAANTGVVPESCFPYPDNPFFQNACDDCDDWESQVTVLSDDFVELKDPATMKNWIAETGPMIAVFTVYLDLYHYGADGGVYRPQDQWWNIKMGQHCVEVIGYDDDKQAWLAKNSWGTGWGDAGFFWIGYNECGFDANMWGVKDFKTIYKDSNANSSQNDDTKDDVTMHEVPSGLSENQANLVKEALHELLLDKDVFVNVIQNVEVELKSLLESKGATEEDLHDIMAYFAGVSASLDDGSHVGNW
ncbi:MAG: hypothetical protein Phog2KO_13910 [Phototrophicaceae bacterium]